MKKSAIIFLLVGIFSFVACEACGDKVRRKDDGAAETKDTKLATEKKQPATGTPAAEADKSGPTEAQKKERERLRKLRAQKQAERAAQIKLYKETELARIKEEARQKALQQTANMGVEELRKEFATFRAEFAAYRAGPKLDVEAEVKTRIEAMLGKAEDDSAAFGVVTLKSFPDVLAQYFEAMYKHYDTDWPIWLFSFILFLICFLFTRKVNNDLKTNTAKDTLEAEAQEIMANILNVAIAAYKGSIPPDLGHQVSAKINAALGAIKNQLT